MDVGLRPLSFLPRTVRQRVWVRFWVSVVIVAMDIYHYPKEEIEWAQSYMGGILRDQFLGGTELENWREQDICLALCNLQILTCFESLHLEL